MRNGETKKNNTRSWKIASKEWEWIEQRRDGRNASKIPWNFQTKVLAQLKMRVYTKRRVFDVHNPICNYFACTFLLEAREREFFFRFALCMYICASAYTFFYLKLDSYSIIKYTFSRGKKNTKFLYVCYIQIYEKHTERWKKNYSTHKNKKREKNMHDHVPIHMQLG